MPVYKDEKTNTFYCKFYYKNYKGERKAKLKRGFRREREAKQWEAEFIAKHQGGASMLFGTLYDLYQEQMEADLKAGELKESTYTKRISTIKLHILPTFQNIPVSQITANDIRQWQNTIKIKYAPNTQRLIQSIINHIFKFASKYQGLQNNPCIVAGNMGSKKTLKSQKIQYWTPEQFNTFLAAIPQVRIYVPQELLKTAYQTFFYTGLRIGELTALTVNDYDSKAHTLSITKSKNEYGKITSTKTLKSTRTIILPAELCSILEEHINMLQDNGPNDELFPIHRSALQQNISRIAKAAGLPLITVHDLRHSHASLLINANVSPVAIAERLGHESIETTLNIYSHLYKQTADNVADYLDSIMIQNKPN